MAGKIELVLDANIAIAIVVKLNCPSLIVNILSYGEIIITKYVLKKELYKPESILPLEPYIKTRKIKTVKSNPIHNILKFKSEYDLNIQPGEVDSIMYCIKQNKLGKHTMFITNDIDAIDAAHELGVECITFEEFIDLLAEAKILTKAYAKKLKNLLKTD